MTRPIRRVIPAALLVESAGLPSPLPRSARQYSAAATAGGRPSEPKAESEGQAEIQSSIDIPSSRHRASQSTAGRSRILRKTQPSALPPVVLPATFVEDNVTVHASISQPRLALALIEDAKRERTSKFPPANATQNASTASFTASYFDSALNLLLLKDKAFAADLDAFYEDPTKALHDWESNETIKKVTRVWDMIIDSTEHSIAALDTSRQSKYTYSGRPFWWWHLHKDLDTKSGTVEGRARFPISRLRKHIDLNYQLDHSLSHAIGDLPTETFALFCDALGAELKTPANEVSLSNSSKRPINILSMSGYSGKGISETIASHIAFVEGADLIRLDAQDLATVVGNYLGQNIAFSRGGLSTLGYRTALANGKLMQNASLSSRHEVDEDDTDNTVITARIAGLKSLEEDLQKIKEGGFDCFTKWEHLKIDKALQSIIQSISPTSETNDEPPVLVHIHDIVELSMTLEGSILLNSLRKVVDNAWRNGRRIAIIGTSSTEQPSDEYQDAVQELSQSDFVVSRHMDINATVHTDSVLDGDIQPSLQRTDIFFENSQNIRRMIYALRPAAKAPSLEEFSTFLPFSISMLCNSILPVPEVYQLARSICHNGPDSELALRNTLMERVKMGPMNQTPGKKLLDEDSTDSKSTSEKAPGADDAKTETRAPVKLNEYEKRIAVGQINKENLRVTFGDVHTTPETISSLKLLTSLALVRPDAFSYGVLAADKIPGCLLYGPPGTGKTMLAKAVAKESGANMLEISGATINDKYVGESEKLIRAVFTMAKRLSPCVVFIDEADSLLANRSIQNQRASHREHINQFLKEWDGMEETNAFIMVATNRPFDLDDAVLRRLPRRLLIDLPLQEDRVAIFNLLLKDETLEDGIDIQDYAKRTPNYSGSDLKNLCVAAAMAAVEEENLEAERHTGPEPFQYPTRRVLKHHHFEQALKNIPASINEDMASLKAIRNFDEQYGGKRGKNRRSAMGFGVVDESKPDTKEARVRQD